MRNVFSLTVILILLAFGQAMAASTGGMTLMGDSEMAYFSEYPWLLPANTTNAAVAGSHVQDATSSVSAVAATSPSKIFLLTGTNDVAANDPVAFSGTYDNLLSALGQTLPDTKVYVSAIFPVNWSQFPQMLNTSNSQIAQFDSTLAGLVSRYPSVTYLDFTALFKDSSGELNKAYTPDGLHLNQSGYTLWSNLLSTYF